MPNQFKEWEEWEIEIIKENYGNLLPKEVQKLLPHRSFSSIHHKASKLGIKSVIKWDESERQILIDNYGNISAREIQKLIPKRTIKTIRAEAKIMGLSEKREVIPEAWSEDEIQVLKDNYESLGLDAVKPLLPNRTESAIYSKAQDLRLKTRLYWEEWELDFLRQNHDKLTVEELTERLSANGRTVIAVAQRLREMGLNEGINYYTPEEDEIIKTNYNKITLKQLCKLLPDRTPKSIFKRARNLKLNNEAAPDWTPEEDEIIKRYYKQTHIKELGSKLPGRSLKSIWNRAQHIGLRRSKRTETGNKLKWDEVEINLLTDNYGKVSRDEILNLLPNRSWQSIKAKAALLGLTIEQNPDWTQLEDEILINSYKVISTEEIALSLNRSPDAVRIRARKIGIATTGREKLYTAHTVDEDFFGKPNLLNSYWAGFIAADGCISGRQSLVICLNTIDRGHLEQFRQDLNFSGQVYDSVRKPSSSSASQSVIKSSSISISCSAKLIKDLKENFKITPRKSLTLQPPTQLNLTCRLAYIVGYLDGDGCVHIKQDKGTQRLNLNFLGTRELMEWIKTSCEEISPITNYRHTAKVNSRRVSGYNNTYYSYHFTGVRAEEFCRQALQLKVPGLKRKWNKIKAHLKLKDMGYLQLSLL